MNVKINQIKSILLESEEISDIQYDNLISIYGESLVVEVIKELIKEDDKILFKVGKFIYKLYLNLDFDNCEFSAYDYYIADIKNILDLTSLDKNNLVNEIVQIIARLNELFEMVENITRLDDDRKKPWIADKVDYCINKCREENLINKIKVLYNEYLVKRDILIEFNLKFVILIANSFYKSNSGLSLDDLIQYGNIGLMRAVETYDPTYDTEFLTYAGYWIKQSIILNSKKMMYSMKIPTHVFDLNNKRLSAIEDLTTQFGRIPTNSEVASYMGISLEKLRIIMDAFAEQYSLDESTGVHLDGSEVIRIELIPDENVNLENDLFLSNMAIELNNLIEEYLDDREKIILRSRYGLSDEKKLTELASLFGISMQRVDQLRVRAFNKLMRVPQFREMRNYLR